MAQVKETELVTAKLGYGKPSTERTRKLKETVWWKHLRGGEYAEEGIMMDMDRASLATESWKETEGEPNVLRRARAVEKILDNITIWIREGQLLVGSNASAPNRIPWQPEGSRFATMELYETSYFTSEDQEKAREILDYWQNRCYQAKVDKEAPLPEEHLKLFRSGVFDSLKRSLLWDSPIIPYEFIAEQGMNSRIAWIERRMKEEYDDMMQHSSRKGPQALGNIDKYNNLKAMAIASKAQLRWARRYSRLAKILAENFETDADRKKELLEISRVCAKIPAEPCESLHEVLQMHWFVMVSCQALERELTGAAMKYDELIEPYIIRDLDSGRLTYDQAIELLECHRLMFVEKGRWTLRFMREASTGSNEILVTTVGGVRSDGTDACSVATDAILDATFNMRTAEPSVAFRWHSKARIETLRKVFNCIKGGIGYPSIKNDENNIKILMQYGAPLEVARHWALVLCMSAGPVGRMSQRRRCVSSYIGAKILELVFYQGFDATFCGMQVLPKELFKKDPAEFESVDEILEAYDAAARFNSQVLWNEDFLDKKFHADYLQQPLLSSMYEGCIELGEDLNQRDEFALYWSNTVGLVDAVDALVGLQKLVFDEKKYTMQQVIDAMKANWSGYEEMRQDFLNAPKFGNDDDYADAIARKTFHVAAQVDRDVIPPSPKYLTKDTPAPIRTLPQSIAGYAIMGPKLGALPNGRKQGDPLADGGCSPWMGFDKKGPTAVLNSCSKLDHTELKGNLLNQRLNPQILKDERGFQLWLNYMKTWCELGLDHVQFNTTDTETLRAAQKDPEKYGDVLVRVAGYSARFIDLSTYIQNSIIVRTEQELASLTT